MFGWPQDGRQKLDYWTEEEFEGRKAYVRVHLRTRVALFTPRGVRASPDKTTMERVTVVKFEDGSMETVRDDNWNIRGRSHRNLGRCWTVKTSLPTHHGRE